ncbi:MAG: hypothetical protein ACXWAY_12395 [Acidimicrobiia bacterium]
MFRVRSPRLAVAALALGLASSGLAAAVVGANPTSAAAASPHQAAVIVDTGGDVHRVVITFDEDSISGIEALQRAGGNPVIYTFGAQGGAVCRIFGVGRDAGPDCLGGQDGDNRYWAYFRAPAGASKFTYSSIGAGSTRVHDGDVEGWKFGTGSAPTFVSLGSLLPPPTTAPTSPPATSPPTQTPSGGATGAGGRTAPSGGQAAGGSTTTSTLPVTGGEAGTPGAAGSGGTSSGKANDRATDANGRTVDTALASSNGNGGGSSGWSLLWFAALIAAIVVAILVVRRVRHAGGRRPVP